MARCRSCPRAWWRLVPSDNCRPVAVIPLRSHRFEWPEAQLGHLPHAGKKENTTWSPTSSEVTFGPTSITTPAPSWPPMHGGSLVTPARSPVTTCSSLWHIPLAANLTSTSPAFGGSRSISSTLHGVLRSHRIAAFVFTAQPPVSVLGDDDHSGKSAHYNICRSL